MKFSISTQSLASAVSVIAKATRGEMQSGTNIPNAVFIEVVGDTVTLRSHKVDFNIVYTLPASDTKDGKIVLPVDILDNVLSSLTENQLSFSLIDKRVVVSTMMSTSDIFVLDGARNAGEKLTLPANKAFSIEREILINGLRSVQHAAAESVIKPTISSVYIYSKDGTVYFVSTDGFRLAEIRFLLNSVENNIDVLIPKKSVAKLLTVLDNVPDKKVGFYVDQGIIFLETQFVIMKTNSVVGDFPDYKKAIPKNFDATITVLRKDVLNFLKKARVFANKLNRLVIKGSDDTGITLSFENETAGSTENTVPAETEGALQNIPSFNYKFVQDGINVIDDDLVTLNVVNNPSQPMMIRGKKNTAITIIISPLLEKA